MFDYLKSYFCSDVELQKQKLPPQWPKGEGDFSTGIIRVNSELELAMVTDFEPVCSFTPKKETIYNKAATYYEPVSIPDGFFALCHCHQHPRTQLSRAYLLVARPRGDNTPLKCPLSYKLVWLCIAQKFYVWEPVPPVGYRALGYVVTTCTKKRGIEPHVNQVRCVREDLTNDAQIVIHTTRPTFHVPSNGVPLALDYYSFLDVTKPGHVVNIGCLINSNIQATMPNLEQVKALIHHYGPRIYFHPDEVYLPSSVPWFLKNHADQDTFVKHGSLETAEVYVHVKPAVGGTFTDFDMWLFFPFKGPDTSTLKLFNFNLNINMTNKMIGQRVAHWEHFTLRISNFDGQLWVVFLPALSDSEESLGLVQPSRLEFVEGTNKPIFYSSKLRHATFPKSGSYTQGGPMKLGIGVRDDAAKSDIFIDASKNYQIIGADYLGDGLVVEPGWMRELRPEKNQRSPTTSHN